MYQPQTSAQISGWCGTSARITGSGIPVFAERPGRYYSPGQISPPNRLLRAIRQTCSAQSRCSRPRCDTGGALDRFRLTSILHGGFGGEDPSFARGPATGLLPLQQTTFGPAAARGPAVASGRECAR